MAHLIEVICTHNWSFISANDTIHAEENVRLRINCRSIESCFAVSETLWFMYQHTAI